MGQGSCSKAKITPEDEPRCEVHPSVEIDMSGSCPIPLPTADELKAPSVLDVDEATKIEFLTDVEGNWEYFLRWVSFSKTLYWAGEDRGVLGPGVLELRHDSILVFGGDAPDKGPGDIRFVRILLDLKARYRDRVFIILGNRDVNKLRFSSELVPGVKPLHPLPWDAKAASLEDWMKQHPECPPGEVTKLKWMLHFMGCQNTTFNTRRHELALLNPGGRVTEEDVLTSFRGSVDPSGSDPWMLRLIQAGKLAVVLGDTLYVHGGIHDAVLGHVPGAEKVCKSIKEWVTSLNTWKDCQVTEFIAKPHWVPHARGEGRTRGGEDLILYGTPGFPDNATVVYYNPFQDGNPKLLSERVETYLADHGIKRVFSGHQPHGQSPTVVRHPASGLLRVTGDTSYSCPGADKLFNPANMRGGAVSVLRVEGRVLVIDGVLADGQSHGCTLHCDPVEDEMPDAMVGRQLSDGSWVKTVVTPKKTEGRCNVQAVLGKGFKLSTEEMHFGKACLKLKLEFAVQKLATPLKDVKPEWLQLSNPCNQITFGPEEDAFGRGAELRGSLVGYDREAFLAADTFIFNLGGVIDKVHNNLSGKTISRLGTDLELEKEIVNKINELLEMGKQVIFTSNNSNTSRKGVARKLAEKGIKIPVDEFYKHVLNTSFTCAWYLKNAGVTNPFILCSDNGILEELKDMGVQSYVATINNDGTPKKEYLQVSTYANVVDLVKKAPDVDAVVVGWDRQLTTLKIDVATAYLTWVSSSDAADKPGDGSPRSERRQIPLVACSSDVSGILGCTPANYLADRKFNNSMVKTLGNGLMAHILSSNSGRDSGDNMRYFDVGQPSYLMLEALTRPRSEMGLGVNPKKAVMIGDVPRSDIAMANRGGMQSLLVFSGETRRDDFLNREYPAHETPTWILNSIADI